MFRAGASALEHVRTVDWAPNAQALLAKYKGQALTAIVDSVRDGSTLRCELLTCGDKPLHHIMVTVFLAGVQSPRTPLPLSVLQQQYQRKLQESPDADIEPPREQAPEPFALEAQAFTAARLLHRDVQVVLLGADKSGNLFGQIVFAKGNISQRLLEMGLGKLVDWSAALLGVNEAGNYRRYSEAAKKARAGLYKNYEPPRDSVNVNDKDYAAKVTGVKSGDSILVELPSGKERSLTLASLRAPRQGNPRRGEAEQPWAFEGKEHLRKKLIGKKVRVVTDFTRPAPQDSADKTERHHATVYLGSENVCESMVAAGLSQVARHRQDEERSSCYDLLLAAEQAALTAGKGLHGKKPSTHKPAQDLSERFRPSDDNKDDVKSKAISAKAKGFLPFLQREKQISVMVEHVFSASRLKLYVPKENIFVALILAGIRTPGKTADGKEDPLAAAALQFVKSRIYQHDVKVDIDTIDKADNFIGSVYFGTRENLTVRLLQEGLASVFGPSADRADNKSELYAAEAEAKAARKGVWRNYVEPRPEDTQAAAADASEDHGASRHIKEGDVLNVKVTEVVNGNSFYFQLVGDESVSYIDSQLQAHLESPASLNNPKKGMVAAGLFSDGRYYRVRIEARVGADDWTVLFLDYGNSATLTSAALCALPADIARLPASALHGVLAGVSAPKVGTEHAGLAVEALQGLIMEQELLARCEASDRVSKSLHLSLMRKDGDASSTINQMMLREGLGRVRPGRPDQLALAKVVEELLKDEETAKRSHVSAQCHISLSCLCVITICFQQCLFFFFLSSLCCI
jgi:staphylococcal nuclease domain-containing protein 1